jgi:hypothetical protein
MFFNNKLYTPLSIDFLRNNLFFYNNLCDSNVSDFIPQGFCSYINKKGQKKGMCCGRLLRKKREYCYEHTYNSSKSNSNKIDLDLATSININNSIKAIPKYLKEIKIIDPFHNNNNLKIQETPLKRNLLICYNNDNVLFKRKKRRNKKQRLRKKLIKKEIDAGTSKLDLNIEYNNINIKDLNDNYLFDIMGDITIPLKIWPLELQYHKDILEYKVIYFHCFINKGKNDIPKVLLYYRKKDVFNNIKITYSELYNLLIKKYNKDSINKFIEYYYKEELSISL